MCSGSVVAELSTHFIEQAAFVGCEAVHPALVDLVEHPVDRIVELLAVPDDRPAVIVDCTLGAGGHAARLLAASGANTHLVGFDRDIDALMERDEAFALTVEVIGLLCSAELMLVTNLAHLRAA